MKKNVRSLKTILQHKGVKTGKSAHAWLKAIVLTILVLLLGSTSTQVHAIEMKEMREKETRVIVICAHPDDAELTTGGTSILLTRLGYKIKYVSLTNGNKGHH